MRGGIWFDTWTANGKGMLPKLDLCPYDKSCSFGCTGTSHKLHKLSVTLLKKYQIDSIQCGPLSTVRLVKLQKNEYQM